MYNHSNSGVTIASIIDNRSEIKSGGYPIKIRVTYRRQRKYYSTGVVLTINQWHLLPTARSENSKECRSIIQGTFSTIKKAVDDLIKEDLFSFQNLDKKFSSGSDCTVNSVYNIKITALKADDRHNTADWYKYSLKALETFAGQTITFKSINIEFLRKYEKHLLKLEKSYTTISMYMRALQSIINDAKTNGTLKPHEYPFGVGKYEIPQHAGRNMALSIKDIAQIHRFECTSTMQEYCRDIWMFSYLCNGANIADICNLKFDDIKNGNIEFYRQKTIAKSKVKRKIIAVITPEMTTILDKWSNQDKRPKNFIFSILNGNEDAFIRRAKIKAFTRSINHFLGQIGTKLGVGHISSYTARHSFATVLKRSGANISFISESLGHSNVLVTENYLAQFEQEQRTLNAKALTNFDNEA